MEVSREGYNISWKTMYQHRWSHLDGKLQYELRYRQAGRPWQVCGPPGEGRDRGPGLPSAWCCPRRGVRFGSSLGRARQRNLGRYGQCWAARCQGTLGALDLKGRGPGPSAAAVSLA